MLSPDRKVDRHSLSLGGSLVNDNPLVDREIVARATALLPILRMNAVKCDVDGVVPVENVELLEKAGLWGLTRPKERGGLEANISTVFETLSELARGCGSTSWIAAVSVIEQLVISFLPPQAQDDIYALTPSPRLCGTFALTSQTEEVEGGLRISGRWGWSSGSDHANWAFMGIELFDSEGSSLGLGQAMIPMTSCSIERTWDSCGLRGTGSHHVIAKDVFVPHHMILNISATMTGEPQTQYEGTLYRSALMPALNLLQIAVAPGLAMEALDETIARTSMKPVVYTTFSEGRLAPTTQLDVAEAATRIASARMHAASAAATIDRAAQRNLPLTNAEHARLRMAAGRVASECRSAMDLLLDCNGASVFLHSNPIQRMWRDMSVAARHAFIHPHVSAHIYGCSLLDAPQIAPLI